MVTAPSATYTEPVRFDCPDFATLGVWLGGRIAPVVRGCRGASVRAAIAAGGGAGGCETGAPHSVQKLEPLGIDVPHWPQKIDEVMA